MLAAMPPPTLSARIIATVLATGFLALGVVEIVTPQSLGDGYGVHIVGQDGLALLSAVGARNIALSLIALFAGFAGLRAALAAVFGAIAVVAALDFYIVSTASGTEMALKHAVFVVLMLAIALWVFFSGRRK